ncbi:MAG: tryptophan--tRNA ligase [Bdellovibrionaceae bacterium]|nr:tryptophan--tRNA ligase [Pseudobdellovibrionaceae bacterium]
MKTEDYLQQRILTGIKPTGVPHFGNYFGAIKPALKYAKYFKESLFFIADYHSLINQPKSLDLQSNIYKVTATWLACGLNPKNSILFRQSDIPEILELSWILACFSPKGMLNRAHAYKAFLDKNTQENKKDLDIGINMGLYSYPVLMSSDILSFDSHIVPVGQDQLQHLEMCRDIAGKINHHYKNNQLLTLPKALDKEELKKITGLAKTNLLETSITGLDGQKMSKSYDNYIPLFIEEKKLRKLIMKIQTDSVGVNDPKDPNKSLIMDWYKLFATHFEEEDSNFNSSLHIDKLVQSYKKGISWGEAKEELFQLVNKTLASKRELYNQYMSDTKQLDKILLEGKDKARVLSKATLARVKKVIFG